MPFSLTPPSIFPPTNKVQHKGSVSDIVQRKTGSCFPQVTGTTGKTVETDGEGKETE